MYTRHGSTVDELCDMSHLRPLTDDCVPGCVPGGSHCSGWHCRPGRYRTADRGDKAPLGSGLNILLAHVALEPGRSTLSPAGHRVRGRTIRFGGGRTVDFGRLLTWLSSFVSALLRPFEPQPILQWRYAISLLSRPGTAPLA